MPFSTGKRDGRLTENAGRKRPKNKKKSGKDLKPYATEKFSI
jgi:hypothetical protein